jgi:pimeloyl-ACP methyl ester carboxylesterase
VTAVSGRLLGTAIAVRDLDGAVAAYDQRGFVLSDRSVRTEWGIEVATFGFADGSYVELVTSTGGEQPIAAAMAAFLDERGDATYLTCIEVDHLDAAHGYLVAQGIGTLGGPASAPPSTGEQARMLWLKPASFGGAFVQLLELQDGPRQYERVTPGRRLIGKRLVVGRAEALARGLAHLGAEGHERLTFSDHTYIEAAEVDHDHGIVIDDQFHHREVSV